MSIPVPPPRAPGVYRQGAREVRADLRSSARIVLTLPLAGIPSGLLWWLLAPRADFVVTEDGPKPEGFVSPELLMGDDVVFVLVLAGVGLISGLAVWLLRRRRGVASVVALAVGVGLCGVVAWQLGEILGRGPTEEALTDVGARLTSSLTLGSLPALAVGPFLAVLTYVAATLHAEDDGLDRSGDGADQAPPASGVPVPGWTTPPSPFLVDAPPPGRPSA